MDETLSLTKIDYQKRVYDAMNYISSNIEMDLPLERIAAVASFSAFHFHRIFKAVVGENVAQFTRRLRLELAANRLLSDPARDITSIAISCGFSTSQNFAKAFRQRYDTSPTRFRRTKLPFSQSNPNLAGPVLPVRNGKTRHELVHASIREMPFSRVATVRRIGIYKDTCAQAFVELLTWAESRVIPGPGKLIAFYWDNPEVTSAKKCRFDCCLMVPDDVDFPGPVFMQTIGGGPWAFCRFEIGADGFKGAWEESFRWLVESGYECRPLPCCEIYYNDARVHPEGKWIIDIAIPLK